MHTDHDGDSSGLLPSEDDSIEGETWILSGARGVLPVRLGSEGQTVALHWAEYATETDDSLRVEVRGVFVVDGACCSHAEERVTHVVTDRGRHTERDPRKERKTVPVGSLADAIDQGLTGKHRGYRIRRLEKGDRKWVIQVGSYLGHHHGSVMRGWVYTLNLDARRCVLSINSTVDISR